MAKHSSFQWQIGGELVFMWSAFFSICTSSLHLIMPHPFVGKGGGAITTPPSGLWIWSLLYINSPLSTQSECTLAMCLCSVIHALTSDSALALSIRCSSLFNIFSEASLAFSSSALKFYRCKHNNNKTKHSTEAITTHTKHKLKLHNSNIIPILKRTIVPEIQNTIFKLSSILVVMLHDSVRIIADSSLKSVHADMTWVPEMIYPVCNAIDSGPK